MIFFPTLRQKTHKRNALKTMLFYNEIVKVFYIYFCGRGSTILDGRSTQLLHWRALMRFKTDIKPIQNA